jgi:hypothetical protein
MGQSQLMTVVSRLPHTRPTHTRRSESRGPAEVILFTPRSRRERSQDTTVLGRLLDEGELVSFPESREFARRVDDA